jgi:hypothetical protein
MTTAEAILTIIAVIGVAGIALTVRVRQPRQPGTRRAPTRRPRPPARPCRTGKVPFASKTDADRVVRQSQTQRRPGYDRPLQRSYRCPHCGHWHTTSQRQRVGW